MGERFLYLVREPDGLGRLMLVEPGKPSRSHRARSRPSSSTWIRDFWFFAGRGRSWRSGFDWKSGRVSGEPISVAERVSYFYSTAYAAFAARAGTIALPVADRTRAA